MSIASRLQIGACCTAPLVLAGLLGLVRPSEARPAEEKRASKIVRVPYSKIASLVKSECLPCHNEKRHPEKVDLSSYRALMQSGNHGPIVIPGLPEKSKLIQYVDGEKQPRMPMRKPPLSQASISLLKKWIASGAKG